MNTVKRVISLVIAVASIFCIGVTAFAEDAPNMLEDSSTQTIALHNEDDCAEHEHRESLAITPRGNPTCKHTSWTVLTKTLRIEDCPSLYPGHTVYMKLYQCKGFLCDEGYTELHTNCRTCTYYN